VPGTLLGRHELNQFAVAADEEVSRNLDFVYRLVVGVLCRIEAICEKCYYAATSELARWQAYRMND
jgi:hypothetical protein